MHISLPPASVAPRSGLDRRALDARIAWLRDEIEHVREPEHKATLRYQIGFLEQRANREAVAVREYLAAINAVARFKEPLERLIAMIERRRSFKNLPTVLDHLCRTASGSAEVARAELAYAWAHIMHSGDESAALARVRAALDAAPSDAAACLTLEILARRAGDPAALRDALARSLAASRDSAWGSLLGLELSESDASIAAHEQARNLLDAVVARGGKLGFRALQRCAELGRTAQRSDWTIQSLEAQLARLTLALADPKSDAARSVPALCRNAASAVDALLQLALLERSEGRAPLAFAALKRALALEPEHPVVVRTALELACELADHESVETLAARELERASSGSDSAELWLVLAESRLARSESAQALEALERSLGADRRAWLAWALQLDLLRGTRDSSGHARALERLAELFPSARSKRQYAELAAATWVLEVGDSAAARAALRLADTSAEGYGARRQERMLAHYAGDDDWYEAACQSLLRSGPAEPERLGLLLELWRQALRKRSTADAGRWLELAGELRDGRFLVALARAYDTQDDAGALAALERLEGLEPEPGRTGALAWTSALRRRFAGDEPGSIAALESAHERYPKSAVVAATLSAWLGEHGETAARAAQVLRSNAAAIAEDGLSASLYIEAGLRSWQKQERAQASLDFEAAERRGAGCAGALASWVRRAREPSFRLADDGATGDPRQRLLSALERAARAEPPTSSHLAELVAALRGPIDADADHLAAAARLLALFLGRALGSRAEPPLLDRFASYHPDAAQLADGWRYLDCVTHGELSPKALEESARRWYESTGGVAPLLEWLAAAARLGNRGREIDVRHALAEQLPGVLGEHCASSAALIAHWSRAEPAPFVSGETAQARLTNLETSPPGSNPERRARALEAAADLLEEESEPIARLLQGYNLLALGDDAGAARCFRRYAEVFPDDPAGHEGLLAAAQSGEDPALLAEATAALGKASRDPRHAARLFEQAADIFSSRLDDQAQARAALERAVELDITRRSSFTRLFELIRDAAEPAQVLALIERRLGATDDRDELATLQWERARTARKLGQTDVALAALDSLVNITPNHSGALALYGEIYITLQRYAEAADKLAQLAARDDVPREERLTSGLAAVDLYENQLSSTKRALSVLLTLHRAGLSTLPVRERLARAAAKSEAWDEAVVVLEQLMFERTTLEQRAEAARLALAIHRDRRHEPRSAGHAAEVLLGALPGDAEALDLALSGALEPVLSRKLLVDGKSALARLLGSNPLELDALRRLARIADRIGDLELRQISVGALVALGQGQSSSRAELAALDQRIDTTPPVAISDEAFAELAHPEDAGAIPALLGRVAAHLGEALGPTPATFKVSKRDRISASAGLPVRSEIAAWVGAFGLGEFELYLSAMSNERIAVLATTPLFVIMGTGVNAPLGAFQRQELVRALYAARRGLLVLTQLDEADAAALIAALCKLGGVTLETPRYARQDDFERQLARGLPRKVQKTLAPLALAVREEGRGVAAWVRAASHSLDRAAALAVGDISVIHSESAPIASGVTPSPSERTLELLRFVLSPTFEAVRRRLGVGPR